MLDDFGLSPYDAGVLVADRETAAYFEMAAEGRDAKRVANWVTGELFGEHLDRDVAAELLVPGAIDLAHAAFADELRDLVVGELAASFEGHVAAML